MSRSARGVVTYKPEERRIKAVFFDAGDLLYHRPNGGERLATFLTELGLSSSSMPERENDELRTMAMIGKIAKRDYWNRLLEFCGVQGEENLARGRRVLDEERDDVSFFDGVKETLLALKERAFLMGIVTDTYQPTAVKLEWLEREGIAHVWDTFVSSCEVGVRKPAPLIYRIALNDLAVEPKQAAFVGHKASELQGAKAVGMTTVAFNYGKDAEADFYIEFFSDLLTLPILSERGENKMSSGRKP